MKRQIFLSAVLVIIIISILTIFPSLVKQEGKITPQTQPVTTQKTDYPTIFSYKGSEGIDALTLLRQKTEIEESQPGFVTSINGRKAETSKKEFWAFYVNYEMAKVGA